VGDDFSKTLHTIKWGNFGQIFNFTLSIKHLHLYLFYWNNIFYVMKFYSVEGFIPSYFILQLAFFCVGVFTIFNFSKHGLFWYRPATTGWINVKLEFPIQGKVLDFVFGTLHDEAPQIIFWNYFSKFSDFCNFMG
jgi:hypothetical protein